MVSKAPVPVAIPGINDGDIIVAAAVGRTMETVDTCRVAVVNDDVLHVAIFNVGIAVVVVRRNVGV